MRRLLIVAVIALLPGSSGPTSVPASPTSLTAVEFAPTRVLDRYEPATTSKDAPVVVLVHGCCGDRRDLAGLARALARRGAVVLNAEIRNTRMGGGWPASYDDAICSVSMARHVAAELPGGPHRVVLVGWSDGALIGTTVALGWSTLAPRVERCAVDAEVSLPPDQFVGLSGYYGWPGADVPAEVVNPGTIRWFGAIPGDDPAAWREANPWSWLTDAPSRALGTRPSFLLLSGTNDPLLADARAFSSALADHGFAVSHVEIALGSHLGLAQPRAEDGAAALAVVGAVIGLEGR